MIFRHPAHAPDGTRRRGVILMVVLMLLTLFAISGLAFALYSGGAATSGRIFKEVTPDYLRAQAMTGWKMFLGQQIYGVRDDAPGAQSALRGHDLARNMYGWDPFGFNDTPYVGTGRLRETLGGALPPNSEFMVNYQYHQGDGFLRDPGRLGTRANPMAAQGQLAGDLHVSYTFPDHNNMYLAVVNPANGQVVIPSYHRDWVAGATLANPGAGEWTTQYGKYRLMRPRPQDHPQFPAPADATGDVKNLDFAPGGNDSIWIDIGAPVMTAPDGKKYKILVAPLILDMDGRINLNAAGNLLVNRNLAADQRNHGSNQGWGPWEINPQRVLDFDAQEWRKLLIGDLTLGLQGRYAWVRDNSGNVIDRRPTGPGGITGGSPVRRYFPMDYNASTDDVYEYPPPAMPAVASYILTPPWQLPGTAQTGNTPAVPSYQIFPLFSQNGYNNAVPRETEYPANTRIHPDAYNPLRPFTGNKAFGVQDLVSLLRRSNVGGDRITSELLRLLPQNLDGSNNLRRRQLVTTHSADLDRPGSPPYIFNANPTDYNYVAATGRPSGAAAGIGFPSLANRGATPADSEFSVSNWASVLGRLGRIDLGRKLTNYPAPNAQWQLDTTSAQFQRAVADRQQLAAEIYDALWRLTGAIPTSQLGTLLKDDPALRAHRWLAQLAVNIVDFIDSDDYMTPFQWMAGQFVFGTEAPRLVVNEYYAQWDNNVLDNTPKETSTDYRVNVWVELHNPFPVENALQDPAAGQAILSNGTTPFYRLLLCRGPNTQIKLPENVLGTPDPGMGHVVGTLTDWGTTRTVKPGRDLYSGAAGSNDGFYVVAPNTAYAGNLAPADPFPAANPITPTLSSAQMTYTLPLADNPTVAPGMNQTDWRPSILLQRLANPYLPEQNDPAQANYNPFITIDYIEQMKVNDYRLYNDAGTDLMPAGNYNANSPRGSFGRNQPYAAWLNPADAIPATPQNWHRQLATALAMPTVTDTRHTFFRHNAIEATAPPAANTANQTLLVPFEVLAHYDRPMASVADLLHVSGYRPHELTQQFVTYTAGMTPVRTPYNHVVPWANGTLRVHRLLDFVTFGSRMAGIAPLGRVPGKVNINTIWDANIFNALADANGSNRFTQAQINAVWSAIVQSRCPDAGNLPGANSRPFWGLGTGQATAADALSQTARGPDSTLLRAGAGRALLEPDFGNTPPVTSQPPLQRFELLSKIMSQLTTRSNVFAVWTTVGFFEVVNPNTTPVQLGGEMVWATGGRVRFRSFALIDRTQLQVWPTYDENELPMVRSGAAITVPANQVSVTAPISLVNAQAQAITTVQHPFANNGYVWRPLPGAMVTYEPDTDNEETVVIGGTAMAPTAVFKKSHPSGSLIISRGNPGPWQSYDPSRDVGVILHQEMLD